MEHLPIVIFEIVLCVFLAFAALAGILFQQIEEKKKIKKLESELDKLKYDAELTGRELSKWVALAKNYGCYNQSELYMMVNSMKNQVDFLCKNRNPADLRYVDDWFRFKKMF